MLNLVIAGDKYIPSTILESIHNEQDAAAAARPLGDLTPRQREVLKLLVQGLPNKAIAQALGLQEVTVKLHLSRIFKKFGARNRTELVRMVMGADEYGDALRS